jgi:hypothetical protein
MRRGISATEDGGSQLFDRGRSPALAGVTSVDACMVWKLRSSETSATVKCLIEEYASGHCRVRITHADQDVVSSWHISRGDATTRAEVIQNDLLHTGWERS